jgi:hypothetical protein
VATLAFFLAQAPAAHAGRRVFGWLHDTDMLPERSVELEQWVSEHSGNTPEWTTIWWGPIVGVTDQIEIAMPVEIRYDETPTGDVSELYTWGLDLHWRLVTSDAETAPKIVPLVRAGVARMIQDGVRGELGLTVTADLGRVHVVAEAGAVVVKVEETTYDLRYGVGAVYALTEDRDLRAGVEVFGQVALHDTQDPKRDPDPWFSAGPTLFWSHGRFWATANLGFGLNEWAPDYAPRIIWAVKF